jgi:hypothetical protein
VELDPSQPPLAFKQRVCELTGVPVERQKLMGKGLWKLMLKDEEDLSKLPIKVRREGGREGGRRHVPALGLPCLRGTVAMLIIIMEGSGELSVIWTNLHTFAPSRTGRRQHNAHRHGGGGEGAAGEGNN